MNKEHQIKYIKHREIDFGKWNACIENAPNRRIYALDWHLDRTAETWDALVYGDYEFVMPLPVKKKLGFKYLVQPVFSQQLGIFPNPPEETAQLFYNCLARKYKYFNLQLNAQNNQVHTENEIEFIPRKNYVLPLFGSYPEIHASYSASTKRNLLKAQKDQLNFVFEISLEEYDSFNRAHFPIKLSNKELKKLNSLIAYGQYYNFGNIYGVFTSENELCAAVYFCNFKERFTYLNAVTSFKGRELNAMTFLIDCFIQKNSGKNVILDFEGSMIPGVASFFKSFGASEETYYQVIKNQLPILINRSKLKKITFMANIFNKFKSK